MPDRRLSSMLYGVLGRIIARVTGTGFLTLTAALTADRSKTFQNTTGTIAELESAQTFTVAQTISASTSATTSLTGALVIGNGVAATSVGIGGGLISAGSAIDTLQAVKVRGTTLPGTGVGLELAYSSGGNEGAITAYDRTGLTYKDVGIYAANFRVRSNGTTALLISGTSASFTAGWQVLVNDTTSASSSTTGALLVGNGTAATNVGIGGGAIYSGSSMWTAASNGVGFKLQGIGTSGTWDTIFDNSFAAGHVGLRYTGTGNCGVYVYGSAAATVSWYFTDGPVAIGASAFIGSERFLVSGGAISTPTATDITMGGGSLSTGANITAGGTLTNSSARILKTLSVVTAAGTTTGLATDHVVIFTGTTTQTYTLPAAAAGRQLIIKNRSTGAVTVNRAGADTIDGLTTLNVAAGVAVILVANGTDWCVI